MNQNTKKPRKKTSQCNQKREGISCPGKFLMSFEGSVPIFVCDSCGYKDETWKIFYDTYLQLYKTREAWDEPKNVVSCVLGIFCHCYKEFYGIEYTFTPSSPNPYGIKECRDVWTLMAMFGKDQHEVRRYIVWLFSKGLNRSAKITNFGYILTLALVQKYKLYASKRSTLTRASRLPEAFLEYCRANLSGIFNVVALETMNDLGALLGSVKCYGDIEGSLESQVIIVAEKMGLIKEGKLYFGETNENSHRQ